MKDRVFRNDRARQDGIVSERASTMRPQMESNFVAHVSELWEF